MRHRVRKTWRSMISLWVGLRIAFHRMRLIDKGATGIGTEQNDFENASAPLKVGSAFTQGILKLLVQDLKRTGKLLLLPVRDMFEGGFHMGTGS